MREFFRNLFSIEEKKYSVVVLIFIGFSILGLWKGFKYGYISESLVNLIEFLGGLVIGGSTISHVSEKVAEYKNQSRI